MVLGGIDEVSGQTETEHFQKEQKCSGCVLTMTEVQLEPRPGGKTCSSKYDAHVMLNDE
jgi:hypothetical protein